MSGAHLRGVKQDLEFARRRVASRIGKPLSPETRARISARLRGTRHDATFRARASERFRGKALSADHRAKIAAALRGRTFSETHRTNIGLSHRGERSFFWKGGVAEQQRSTSKYKRWRAAVHRNSGYCCAKCGKGPLRPNERIADHIKPWAKFPELRFEVSNGRTLCLSCDRKGETYGARSWVRDFVAAQRLGESPRGSSRAG